MQKKRTGQNYHIQTKNERRFLTREAPKQKSISCSWTTTNSYMVSGTDVNGNPTSTWQDDVTIHHGSQDAIVEDYTYEERKEIVIFDEKNPLRFTTEFIKGSGSSTLKTLSTCR